MMSKLVKWLIRIVVSAGLAAFLFLFKVKINQSVIRTLYTVNGILFSIALSQLVSFSLVEIENDEFVRIQRKQNSYLRVVFIVLFAFDTIAFLISELDFNIDFLNYICLLILLFSLCYDVVNFCSMAKAKDEIEDRIRIAKKK